MSREELLRLAEKVRSRCIADGECLLWQGAHHQNGYGCVWDGTRNRGTHRVAYEAAKGLIPQGLHIDHLCRRPACCNPDHLEAVTPAENTRRGRAGVHVQMRAAGQTHCVNGHEISAANTYTRKDGRRQCRKCKRVRDDRIIAGLRERGLTQAGNPRKRRLSDRSLTPLQLRERHNAK